MRTRDAKETTMSIKALIALVMIGVLVAPAAASAQEEVIYFHTDAIGSVRATTNNSGAVHGRYDFLPFGELWPSVPPPPVEVRQFAGKEREKVGDHDLDYFGARYHFAVTGRFTTVDPVLNIEAAMTDPQRWNRYSYVTNRPFVMIDPDGREPVTATLAVMGGIGAAVYGTWNAYVNVTHGRAWHENLGVEASKGFLVGATLGLAAPALAAFGAGTIETSAAIASALRSTDAARQFEGATAKFLADRDLLKSFDITLAGRQIDAIAGKTQSFIIEMTTGSGRHKLAQAAAQARDTGLEVIIYGRNLTDGFVREAMRQGVKVARSPEELEKLLF